MNYPAQSYDWASRYGPHWHSIAKKTEDLQTVDGKVLCAWCGNPFDRRETQVHHALYSLDGKTLLRDNAVPLQHVFAVCGTAGSPGTCHHALHQHPLWIEDTDNRVAGDRNNDDVIYQLRANVLALGFTGEPMNTEFDPIKDFVADDAPRYPQPTESTPGARWNDRVRTAASRGQERYEEGDFWFRLCVWLLAGGLLSALFVIASIGIAPYVALVMSLSDSQSWLDKILLNLPFIGWVLKTWGGFVAFLGGVMLWALVQALKCLWLLIGLDKKALDGAVSISQRHGRFQSTGALAPEARRVQRRSRKIPFFFIKFGGLLSLGAYGFCAAIGLAYYPPAESFGKFMFALTSGLWSGINMPNLAKFLICLVMFELVLLLFLVVVQWMRSRRAAEA